MKLQSSCLSGVKGKLSRVGAGLVPTQRGERTVILRSSRLSAARQVDRSRYPMRLRRDLKVASAWALKERFCQFWDYTYHGAAQTFFAHWFWRATQCRLQPMAAVAKLL